MTSPSPASSLVGRSILFDRIDGGPRGRGTLVRLTTGHAVIRTPARPPLGTAVRLRVYGTPFGELALPGVVRWHADDTIGMQLGTLRARQVYALHRLPAPDDESPRLRLQRSGFELDAIDVVALAATEAATMVLPVARARRGVVLWLRNAHFDANLLELDAHRIVISAPVALAVGMRVAISVRVATRERRIDVPAHVTANAAGRTVLAYARATRAIERGAA
jgi:hypothetical protein